MYVEMDEAQEEAWRWSIRYLRKIVNKCTAQVSTAVDFFRSAGIFVEIFEDYEIVKVPNDDAMLPGQEQEKA